MIEGKSAVEISELIKKGEIGVEELTQYYISKIREKDGEIRAFLAIAEEFALKQAKEVQKKIRELRDINSPLVGIPIAVKDIIATQGIETTCASKILKGWIPPYDATVIGRLKEAGVIIIGKTNLDEFAMGSSTENSAFFPTKNPWDTQRVPGGSSGGSAAAVGSGEVLISLGTDTGGSIRQPASFCGVVGLCPTYGRVSRYGLVAFASSLDRIGPITLFVEDSAALLDIIGGYDPLDSTCPPAPKDDYLKRVKENFKKAEEGELKKIKIGVPKEFMSEGVDIRVKNIVERMLQKLHAEFGFELVEVSLPLIKYAVPIYYIVAPAEASSNLARYDGIKYGMRENANALEELYKKTRTEGFGEEVRRRIFIGTFVLSSGYYDAYYLKAQKAITLLKRDFDRILSEVDFIAGPVSPEIPFKLGEKKKDPIKMYLSDIFTIPSSLAGLPAISVPAGFVEENGKKLPVGLQIIGRAFDEVGILTIAKCVESINQKTENNIFYKK